MGDEHRQHPDFSRYDERLRKEGARPVWRLRTENEQMREALRAICGPADSGPWVEVYRTAGGGYEGLQAIARAALGEDQ